MGDFWLGASAGLLVAVGLARWNFSYGRTDWFGVAGIAIGLLTAALHTLQWWLA